MMMGAGYFVDLVDGELHFTCVRTSNPSKSALDLLSKYEERLL